MHLRFSVLCFLILTGFLPVFRSAGAQTWERVDPAGAGLDPANQRGFAGIAAEGDVVLASQRAVTDIGIPVHELFLSEDGGVTWESIPAPSGGAHEDVEVIDGRLYTYSTSANIYYSDDDGTSWTKASGFSPFSNGLYEFRLGSSDSDALIGSNGVGAYRSTDGGASWTVLPTPTPDYASNIPFAPGRGSDAVETASGAILLSDFSAGIYRTTDVGTNWTQSWVSPGFNQGILHLTLRPDGSILAHVNNPRSTLVSEDDGATWTETELVVLSAAELRGADDALVVWSGGDDRKVRLLEGDAVKDLTGDLTCVVQTAITTTHLVSTTRCPTTEMNELHGIYRLDLDTHTSAEEHFYEDATLAVWPNPAVGATINTRLTTARSGPVIIRLFDVLGREVHREFAVVTAGQPTDVVLDVARFATGVYILDVEGAGRMSRPVVLRR